jgi:hypothetical protein
VLRERCRLPETYNENGPVVFLRVLIVPNPPRDNAERHFSAPVKAAATFSWLQKSTKIAFGVRGESDCLEFESIKLFSSHDVKVASSKSLNFVKPTGEAQGEIISELHYCRANAKLTLSCCRLFSLKITPGSGQTS